MTRFDEIYRAEALPVFQNRMFDSVEAARGCVRGDIVLVRDRETGLIFNRAFDPQLMRYDANYQNEQAVSAVFRQHLDEVVDIIQRHFAGRHLIEIGCGKGYLLEYLHACGFSVMGLDPAYEGDSPHVIKAYFTPGVGLRADALIMRHVLEHVPNPVEFLGHIRDANGGGGDIYIEVPCFDWILAHRAWFDIYYEHVNYFRAVDFQRMFGTVRETGHLFGGQYLYVVADLATLRSPRVDNSDAFVFPSDFLATVTHYAEKIKMESSQRRGQAIVWGGASKGVIFSLFMQRAGAEIDFVIDINPAKQGKYLAATGLRVSSPQEVLARVDSGANIFVMNGNYLPEIRKMTHDQFNYFTVDHENI